MAAADQPVQRVTIVGGGTAGWMTAAVLSQWLNKVEIRLIESEQIGTIGVGEATIPHIRNFIALAGIDPLKMISESKATFKLGIQFVDWGAPGETYIHGFGKIGRDMLWLHPHQLWLAARERVPDRIRPFRFLFDELRRVSSRTGSPSRTRATRTRPSPTWITLTSSMRRWSLAICAAKAKRAG